MDTSAIEKELDFFEEMNEFLEEAEEGFSGLDDAIQDKIFENYDYMWQKCMSYTKGDHNEADDIMQDTLEALYRSRCIQHPSTLGKRFFGKCVKNRYLMKKRKEKNYQPTPCEIDEDTDGRPAIFSQRPQQAINSIISSIWIESFKEELGEQYFEIIALKAHGFNNVEIAERMGLSRSAVENKVRTARKYARRLLEQK